MKRGLVGLAIALGSVGGAMLFRQRRRSRSERVSIQFEDGSMVTLEHGSAEADRVLAVAHAALRSA